MLVPAMRRQNKKRKRRGYVRPSRATPKSGWSLRVLAALSGVAKRTIQNYLQRNVMGRPRFMGPATRYQRAHLVSLLAIRRLRATEKLALDAIRTRLASFSELNLEAFATQDVPAGALADALGIATPPNAIEIRTRPALNLPRWARVDLALGLELHVCDDASARVVDLARRIQHLCESAVRETVSPLGQGEIGKDPIASKL
jgi:DNA-binding transcriptional MerR regulator